MKESKGVALFLLIFMIFPCNWSIGMDREETHESLKKRKQHTENLRIENKRIKMNLYEQMRIASFYTGKENIGKDIKKAALIYKSVAKQTEDTTAATNTLCLLGVLYLQDHPGCGWKKQSLKAVKFLEEAAGKRSVRAYYELGGIYEGKEKRVRGTRSH